MTAFGNAIGRMDTFGMVTNRLDIRADMGRPDTVKVDSIGEDTVVVQTRGMDTSGLDTS